MIVTGEHLDAIQGGDDAALYAAGVERLVALQLAVDLDEQVLESLEIEAAQAVAQHIVAKPSRGLDPSLQGGFGQIGLQLLKAGQPKDKAMEHGQEHRLGCDLGTLPGVTQLLSLVAELEHLVQVAGEGGQRVAGLSCIAITARIQSHENLFPSRLPLPLPGLLWFPRPAQQLAVDLGDALQMLPHLVVVLDPVPNLFDLLCADQAAFGSSGSQGDGQVPHRTMPFATGAPAGGVPTGDIAFEQGTA